MSQYKEKILKIIKPIFDFSDKEIIPATEEQIAEFKKNAIKKGVPEKTILELESFYQITNGIPCIDSLSIHKVNDIIIFEFWDDNELWIGQRDLNIIRWKNDKYHLGSAANLNYGNEYISDSLVGILEIGINDWYSNNK